MCLGAPNFHEPLGGKFSFQFCNAQCNISEDVQFLARQLATRKSICMPHPGGTLSWRSDYNFRFTLAL